jgi:MYXO-CTERM domain-containing protein
VCDGIDNNCDGVGDDCSCTMDSDCGDAQSGQVCSPDLCIPGCRGINGNGCPIGEECTSMDESVGQCVPESGTGGSQSGTATGDSMSASATDTTPTEGSVSATESESATESNTDGNSAGGLDDEGFGCECNSNGSGAPMGLALLGLLALGRRRRSDA